MELKLKKQNPSKKINNKTNIMKKQNKSSKNTNQDIKLSTKANETIRKIKNKVSKG
jgi:hypothetical protein